MRQPGRRRRKRPGQITLRVLDGPPKGQEQTLTGSRVRVGRSDAADFIVDHPALSGLHFELRIRRAGIELFDLSSKNGTKLFDRLVYHARVQLGDVIVAGDCRIELVDSTEVEVALGAEAQEDGLLGVSDAIQETFAAIDAAALCDLPTLVCGETGTGKELAARAIHRRSSRSAAGRLVVLDCSTLPAGLAESAILGHCKGAFTGADDDRRGVFEEANEGTLMLDEIAELPLALQAKLLRVLDRGEVVRVGENEPRRVDVRIIAATHADLPRMVDEGRFRRDLYYRLNGLVIEMPSLRDRGRKEIEYLASAFLAQHAEKLHVKMCWSPEAVEVLVRHPWRGNVRELASAVTRAVAMRHSDNIEPEALSLRDDPAISTRLAASVRFDSYDGAHAELDRTLLPRIVAECSGDLGQAARRLGRTMEALIKRMRALGLYTGT